jgi:putative nucleotidyltransferase with HDIG domain
MRRIPNSNNSAPGPPRFLGVRLTPVFYSRAAMAAATSVLLFLAMWTRVMPTPVSLALGDQAPRTIRAPRSTTYLDTKATEDRREKVGDAVPDQYVGDPEAAALAAQTVNDIFAAVRQVQADETLPDEPARMQALMAGLDIPISEEAARLAVGSSESALERRRNAALRIVREHMQQPIRDNTDDLIKAQEAASESAKALVLKPAYQAMVGELAAKSLRANQLYDDEKTTAERNRQAAEVEEVTRQIQADDIVIASGETVTQRHLDCLKALGLMQPRVDYTQALTLLVLLVAMVLLLGVFVFRFAPEVYADNRQLVLLCAVLVLAAAAFRGTQQWSVFAAYVLGISTAVAMTVAMLLGTRLAVVVSAFLGLLAGMVATGSDARLVIVTILCSTFASYAISTAGSKSLTVARAAGLVGLANAVLFAATSEVFGLMISVNQVIATVLAGLISASVAVVAAMALERVVGVTSELRLLELANPNERILHRLLTEAPGTYQGSVMVGNLAEAAAEEIGADQLLVRTAAMYHDIGKLKRPYFFIENQFGGDNPHDKLKPHLSALTLIAHARDGYELAREIGLPDEVAAVTREHHGTALASIPYHAALEQEGAENVNEADYRYPGPRPQSRASALIMLADSVEAAARTLVNPDREGIEELVEELVAARVADGQLDESPLTFADLTAIKRSFVSTLTGMFHQRLRYPEQEPEQEQQVEQRERAQAPVPGQGGSSSRGG